MTKFDNFTGLTIANIIPIMMLGRKQSLKGEPVLADYGPEEFLNESADIEWVNKVRKNIWKASKLIASEYKIVTFISAVGAEINEALCSCLLSLGLSEHSKDIWKSTAPSICYFRLWSRCYISFHCRNDCQNAYTRYTQGKFNFFPTIK